MRSIIVLGTWINPQDVGRLPAAFTREIACFHIEDAPMPGDILSIEPRGYRIVSRVFTVENAMPIGTFPPGVPDAGAVMYVTFMVAQVVGPPHLVADAGPEDRTALS